MTEAPAPPVSRVRWRNWAGNERTDTEVVQPGSVDEVAAALSEYARVGFRHPILIFRSPWDLETIGALGSIREAVSASL